MDAQGRADNCFCSKKTCHCGVSRMILVLSWLWRRGERGCKSSRIWEVQRNFTLVTLEPKVLFKCCIGHLYFSTYKYCRWWWIEHAYQLLGFQSLSGGTGLCSWAKMDIQTRKLKCENQILMTFFFSIFLFYSRNKYCKYLGVYTVSLAIPSKVISTGFTHSKKCIYLSDVRDFI